jgi:two-component system chemotaxis response regulator CheB
MVRALTRRKLQPGSRIRVLVVDDSVVIRRLVTHALCEEPMIEVVGSAPNGAIALERIQQLNPDVVTLDVEMPEMDGLEVLRRLRDTPHIFRVIMFSTLTLRGASATMDALTLGADDYVTKAANAGSLDVSMASLRNELVPKVKQFFDLPPDNPAPPVPVARRPVTAGIAKAAPRILVLGVSTGGPAALGRIIPTFPADFRLPILIVQHMPPLFTRFLAERLQATSSLKVEEAADGALVEAGKILIAPGDYHMRVTRHGTRPAVSLDQGPLENSCRPSVDVLFRSVETVYGGDAIGVVLTGMGYDGMRGAAVMKAAGASIIAQDEATSVVWGMPGAVVKEGLADAVVPLDGVLPAILERVA